MLRLAWRGNCFASLLLALSLGLGLEVLGVETVASAEVTKTQVTKAEMPLRVISPDQLTRCCQPALLGLDSQLWESTAQGRSSQRQALLQAIAHSLAYLQTAKAKQVYQQYPVPGITQARVQRSLERFRQLVLQAKSPAQLQAAVRREFIFYQAIGKDQQGTVAFTGYFEPVYSASRVPTQAYRYPLYRVPPTLTTWAKPHPTRLELEGADGLQADQGRLKGLELVWLRDRFQAFLVQVQGSAQLQLTDGTTMTVGFAGRTDHPYTGVGRELVKDGKLRLEELSLDRLVQYFQAQPQEMNQYLPRNQSFIFFRSTQGAAATGSLGVPVTAERSIATDKSLMPPGALALIQTQLPYLQAGKLKQRLVSRYVLDQDTGSAIRGPGRVDVFIGSGPTAGDRAGNINATGQLYYLLLKEPSQPSGKP